MKGKFLRKICAVSLSILMFVGTGIANVMPLIDTGLSVSAAETTTDGNYEYYVNTDGSITITNYKGNDTEVVIPSEINGKKVTIIGMYAFSGRSITSITMPDTITEISDCAFWYNRALTSIVIPKSVVKIGFSAFFNCTNLNSITMPDSVSSMKQGAFDDTAWYNNQPDGDVYLGKFYYRYKGTMPQNTSIKIKDGTKGIGGWAFYNESGLTSVTIPETVTEIGYSSFMNCTNLTSISMPDSVVDIGSQAFYSCTSLKSANIPQGVTVIDSYTFSDCTSLESIIIPNSVTRIGSDAFSGCTDLTSIEIPESVTTIGSRAFAYCTNLTDIQFPDSDIVIQHGAFYHTAWYENQPDGVIYVGKTIYEYKGEMPENTSLVIRNGTVSIPEDTFKEFKNLVSVTLPESITSIGEDAFSHSGLTKINIPNSVLSIGSYAFCGCDLTSITIPKSITSIQGGTFSYCHILKKVIIPDSVTVIDSYAFNDCQQLTDVSIPNSTTTIGKYAFAYCKSLEKVVIPRNVKEIGAGAFSNCSDLEEFIVEPENQYFSSSDGILFSKDKSKLICFPEGKVSDEYIIPNSVVSIEDGAFEGCSLTNITIPNNITYIGSSAFAECRYLTNITIPNSVTSIADETFSRCYGLKDVSIPDSVISIGSSAFEYCDSLSDIILPDSVTSISNSAFWSCDNLERVTLPKNITKIERCTFAYCPKLKSIIIPNKVTRINEQAFDQCSNLESITIPSTVEYISSNRAFRDCDNLTIYGKKGTYAETYATENGIPFMSITFPLNNVSVLSADSVILGKNAIVTCAAEEGTAPYTYAVYYRKAGTTKWTTAQGYKTNATVKITPKAAVNYEIRVAVKDANGQIVRKDMTLAVKKPFTNTSKLNLETIKLGEKVKVRCFAENGETPYTFSVQYKKSTSEKWVNVAINSTNNIFVFKPGAAVTYDIRVTAKSPDGQASKKILMLTVTK